MPYHSGGGAYCFAVSGSSNTLGWAGVSHFFPDFTPAASRATWKNLPG